LVGVATATSVQGTAMSLPPARAALCCLTAAVILGVGVFDWLENLFYLVAIHACPTPDTVWTVVVGLTFK